MDGLILLGAYLYGGYPAEKALTVYGDLNTTVAEKVDYTKMLWSLRVEIMPGLGTMASRKVTGRHHVKSRTTRYRRGRHSGVFGWR